MTTGYLFEHGAAHMELDATDPRSDPRGIPINEAPLYVGRARLACGEVRIAAEAIAREGGELERHARRLAQHAIRLGQVANALSAVPVSDVAVVYLPPGIPLRRRVVAAWRAAWVILRGKPVRTTASS